VPQKLIIYCSLQRVYNSVLLFEPALSNTRYEFSGSGFDTLGYPDRSEETAYFYKTQLTNAFYFPANLRKTLMLGAKFKIGYIHILEGRED